jgi:hypothetical protein
MTVLFYVPGVYVATGVGGVGEKGLGVTTAVDVKTLLEAFFIMFLIPACFIDKAFSGKNQIFRSGDYFPQVELSGFPDYKMPDFKKCTPIFE